MHCSHCLSRDGQSKSVGVGVGEGDGSGVGVGVGVGEGEGDVEGVQTSQPPIAVASTIWMQYPIFEQQDGE